jgi:hypothetical protein
MAELAADRRWHLDKKVPIAIIVTLLIQTGGIIWWARGIDKTQADQQRRIEAIEKATNDAALSRESVTAKMASIETALKYQNDTLIEIKAAVRDLVQRRGQ